MSNNSNMPLKVAAYLKGVGITKVTLDDNNNLIFTMSNGKEENVGALNVDDALSDESRNPVQNMILTQIINAIRSELSRIDTESKGRDDNGKQYTDSAVGAVIRQLNEHITTFQGFLDYANPQLARVESGSVVTDNTSQRVIRGSNKPVSGDAVYQSLNGKVDKEDGKGLSANDYTTEDKRIVNEAKTTLPSMQTVLNEHSDTLINHESRITENLNMVEISWSDLKNKRDDGDLIFGTLYRINDYVTTTTQENTRSAGHQFNVIVLALAPNTLSEEAYAIWASDDGYFESNNLSAWKIWYCLDNDTTRFAWADEVNGKGVIYRMIDEFGNDCPYDFKNIQFLRNIILNNSYPEISEDGIRTWVYTFCARAYHTGADEWSELKDGSLESPYGHESDDQTSTFHHNVMMPYIKLYDDGEEDFKKCGIAYLNNNVFFGWYEERYSSDAEYPYYNAHCCYNNTLGNDCYNNTFGHNCYNNTFGSRCNNNTFGHVCYYNTLGNDSFGNVLGCFCLSNHYGNYCYSNRLGDSCAGNILADGSAFNRLQEECCYNIFSNYCSYNNLGVSCSNNSFGSGCDSNSMYDSSSFNSFGNGCCSNGISKRGIFNRFGNGAIGNILGQFYKSITLGEDVCYVRFTDGGNGSDTSMVQNYQVANGLKGTEQKPIHVSVQRNLPYETTIARNTKGTVVLLCLVG